MKELVETIVKELVEDGGAIEVVEKDNPESEGKLIEIKVAKEDMGRVIGKEGRIAKAIRTLIRAAATKQGLVYRVDIIE